jgi:two-component system sensor histidine kinase BaeS
VGTALVWLVLSAVGVVGSAPFIRLVSGIGLVLGLGAVAISVLVLRRFTRPATGLVDAAGKIELGDYSARVPVRGPRELRSLARAINTMSSRLEAEEARRQSILADVAHELRTPLTIIRGQAEGIVDGVYPATPDRVAPILAATRTLEMLVEDLRTLGLAEIGSLRLQREPVDLGVLVNEALEGFRTTAAEGGVTLVADIAEGTPSIDGDPARLRGVLSNLLTNALRYTPRGGTVRVSTVPTSDGLVRLSVQDTGQGIPSELVDRVFDRFVKDKSSTGSGLGLAIVRDVVEAHGGSVVAHSDANDGTTIAITLPVAANH